MRKATHQQTKEHNRNLVLKTIFEHECISRADIARLTSLTRTTVSDMVSDLLAEGLVSEVGLGASIGGKSPILLSLQADSRCLIGLDLAHNQFTGAVVNLRGKILSEVRLPVKAGSGIEALELVYQVIDQLVASANQPVVGISIGTPGLINTSEGLVVNAVNLEWRNLPLSRMLTERYSMPVYVLNDSQAAAMGEYTYSGRFQSEGNLIVINARHGIGAGIVINGKLFQGDGGGAGEIGHVVVVPVGGLPCRCGNFGCLETVTSVQALVKRIKQLDADEYPQGLPPPEYLDLASICQAFHNGDLIVRRYVLETANYMGLAISNLIGTLNIQNVSIVGDMTCFGEPWLEVIRQTIPATTLSTLAQNTQVQLGHLGFDTVVLGASALLANNYTLLFNNTQQRDLNAV